MKNTAIISLLGVLLVQSDFEPARLQSVGVPIQPPMTAGGGEVLLELVVGASGEVRSVTTLRSTPPFTEQLRQSAAGWTFRPAREAQEGSEAPAAVESRVLVAGLFRPPTLYNAPARGEVPRDVAQPSTEVPFPTSTVPPLYPPTAHYHLGQSVLVEVEVGEGGQVTAASLIGSAAGLEAAALDAARNWQFRPARRNGQAVVSFAYLVFGFREPVISSVD